MPNVVIHRPGHSSPNIDPNTGAVDPDWIDWSFNATVDGQTGVVSAIFRAGTSESDAASLLHRQLVMEPDSLEGILSAGGGGGGGGGGGAAGGASGPAGGDGSGVIKPPDEVKTSEGGSTSTQGGGGGGGGEGGGGAQGPAGAGEGGGVIVPPAQMQTEDGT